MFNYKHNIHIRISTLFSQIIHISNTLKIGWEIFKKKAEIIGQM